MPFRPLLSSIGLLVMCLALSCAAARADGESPVAVAPSPSARAVASADPTAAPLALSVPARPSAAPATAPSTVPYVAVSAAAPATCFRIDRVVLEGLVPELGWLQRDVDRFDGTCVDVKGVDAIVRAAQHALLDRGYTTTRVRIPEQDLSQGEFRLLVTPGIIRNIKVRTSSSLVSWRNAYPTGPGHLLNIRDLEQGLEQMKRVPSQDVQMQIAPGDRPGESDVDIDVTRARRWRVSFDVNDAGSAPTGPLQDSATFSLDSPLHLNDLFNLSLNGSVHGGVAGGSRGNGAYYSVPLGYWTLELSASNNSYTQTIAGRSSDFTLSGTSHNGSVALERMLKRSQISKTSVTMRIVQSSSRSFVDDTEIDVQRQNSSYGEIVFERSLTSSQTSLDVRTGFRAGLPLFGALPDQQGVQGAPTSYYTMETADITASAVVNRTYGLKLSTHFNAQFTGDHISLANDFSIGNRYTVRGFDGQTALAADSGYFLRNELEVPLHGKPTRALYFAYDTGQVFGPTAAGLAGTSLSGIAMGLRGGTARASFDVFTGIGLSAPVGFHSAQPAGGIDLTYRV